MKKIKYLIFILFITIPTKSFSLIEVDITRGNLNPLPIAVSPLSYNQESRSALEKELKIEDLGSEISKVIENNLKKSGLFNPLNKDAFLQKPDIAHLKPRFEDWALIKAQALLTGKVDLQDEKLRVEFRLDRKSTRLNSSHVVISYAVFCLKKKKNKYNFKSFSSNVLSANFSGLDS